MPKNKTNIEKTTNRSPKESDLSPTMGGRIANARAAQGLTPEQLAAKLGVLNKTVMNWEADRSEPRGNKLLTLAGVLGISLMWLSTGEELEDETIPSTDPESSNLAVKMEQLLFHHKQAAALILELQQEISDLNS